MIAQLKKINTVKNAVVAITGSKSESNRLLILQALFPDIAIENLSNSDDTVVLSKALKSTNPVVDIHHAGTAMRFLTAYFVAKKDSNVVLTGSSRMQERPIGLLVQALREMGANIEYQENEGFPPLQIKGVEKLKNKVTIAAGVSSQYISALMLIAPSLKEGLKIELIGDITSRPYLEMTLKLLKEIGVTYHFQGQNITISPLTKIAPQTITVESDWSSASYFYSLVALSSNMSVTLSAYKKDSLQGDASLATVYENFGVITQFNGDNTITITKEKEVDLTEIHLNLINTPDIAQTIAVTSFGLGISCNLTGLHTLKIKETDRLEALKTELSKLGASINVTNKSLHLKANSVAKISEVKTIETYQDHRMAMAFAPLALLFPVAIEDPMVVSKSYPEFYSDLEKIGISTTFLE
ncbi:3-phosphoshikimate 1-carboxyvinyltransferase [Patiriisocius marinistellae]|uniref:3-phosphoshikimate 1-carboxyvinyltransferase n=1 Tax=Patiriisocius marinistellae TaxID=2494560 RepID=A0A5J4FW27_9FLAO|nr:3-phosphoshikimate 1-carboxyvinyltransferase [Patiriisocius marinistellae]GEQ86937.1 3-phosphoshikimate 1-carboxyvinyltransferase [Patiriisocius marinistellae]